MGLGEFNSHQKEIKTNLWGLILIYFWGVNSKFWDIILKKKKKKKKKQILKIPII
jgi:hypothetical protein